MGSADIEDLRDRLARLESGHGETATLVAVLVHEMQGIRWLLRSILGTIIVAVVGAIVTAWVQIPRAPASTDSRSIEAPK